MIEMEPCYQVAFKNLIPSTLTILQVGYVEPCVANAIKRQISCKFRSHINDGNGNGKPAPELTDILEILTTATHYYNWGISRYDGVSLTPKNFTVPHIVFTAKWLLDVIPWITWLPRCKGVGYQNRADLQMLEELLNHVAIEAYAAIKSAPLEELANNLVKETSQPLWLLLKNAYHDLHLSWLEQDVPNALAHLNTPRIKPNSP